MQLRRWLRAAWAVALVALTACVGAPPDGEGESASEATTPGGLRCDRAIPLHDGDVLAGERTPARGTPDTTCLPSDAPRRFYSFTVPPGRRAIVTVTPASRPALEIAARLRADCEATECVAAGMSTVPGEPVTLFYDNDAAAPRFKVLEVSAFSARDSLRYDVSLRLVPAGQPMGAACRDAIPLAAGATLLDQALPPNGAPADICPAGGTLQVLYAVAVPPFSRVLVSGQGPPYDYVVRPMLRALESCDSMKCLAVDRPLRSYLAASVAFENPTDVERTFIASVSNPAPTPASFSFRMVSRVESLAAPIASAYCAEATLVRNGTLLSLEDTRYGALANPACSAPGEVGGKVLYYSIRVPAGRTLRVTVEGSNYARTRLLESCGALRCVGSVGGRQEDINTFPAVWPNTTGEPRTILAAVSGRDGAYDIQYRVRFDLVPTVAATNVTCAAATALTGSSGFVTGSTAFSAAGVSACVPEVTGPAAWYSVTIPAHTRLTLTATPPGVGFGSIMQATVRVLDACGAASCVASHTGNAPFEVDNPTGAARPVVIAVATTPASLTEFDLAYSLQPL